MTALYVIMIIVAVITAGLFTFRRSNQAGESALLLKTAASLAFIILGCVAWRGSATVLSIAVIPGLVMGLVGDIFLDMKYIYPQSSTLYTYTGFGAFMLGHVFYLIFLLRQFGALPVGLIISIIIGIAAGIGIYLTPEKMQLNYGRFHIISSCYAAFLVFLTVYSFCACIGRFTAGALLFFLGLLLFLFSDLVLSQIYFGEDKNTPQYAMVNHAAYYLGQILIAASIMCI